MNHSSITNHSHDISKIVTDIIGYKVPSDKNLFESGLNSLKTIKLLAQIENDYGKVITIMDVFKNPTISSLNNILLNSTSVTSQSDIITSNNLHLNYIQRSIWIHQKTNPSSFLYNIPCLIKINKHITHSAVEKIIYDLFKSYPELRSVVKDDHDLIIDCNSSHKMAIKACETIDGSSMRFICNEFYREPFDLNNYPPIRILLLTKDNSVHSVFIVLHHIIADGWSVKLLSDYLCYLLNSNMMKLQTVPVSSTAITTTSTSDSDLSWWVTNLKSLPDTLPLPIDFTRPQNQTFSGGLYNIELSDIQDKFMSSCANNNVTPYVWLLGVTSLFLSRYCHVDDIILGTAMANRPRLSHQNSLGCFANVLPLLLNINSSNTFSSHLHKIQLVVNDALSHQSVSFDQIVNAINPVRNSSNNPIFQVLYSYRSDFDIGNGNGNNQTEFDLELFHDFRLEPTSKFDISFLINETEAGLSISIEYNSDLFLEQTIASMASCYKHLLDQSILLNDQVLNDFSMLTTNQIEWLDNKYLKSSQYYHADSDINIIDYISGNDDIAIYHVGRDNIIEMSYKELSSLVSKLSNNLEHHKGRLVGVLLPRGVDAIAFMAACLQAEVPYLPIDINLPISRVIKIIEDSEIRNIIISNNYELPNNIKVNLIQLSELMKTPLSPDLTQTIQNKIAYQIYTSGTSGRSKGVPIKRESLFNLIHAMKNTLNLSNIRSLSLAQFSFDMSVPEIYLPLFSNGCIILADTELKQSPNKLTSIIDRFDINFMQATPSLWTLLLGSGWDGSEILNIVCGAEELNTDLVNKLYSKCNRLWNFYGPTEATVWCTAGLQELNQSNLGESLPGYDIYLLDTKKRKVAIGSPGEIHIGGHAITNGYINNSQENEKRFILNKNISDTYIYSTGDIARIDGYGGLKYLGRNDFQTKILGYRIDLVEIENAIRDLNIIDEVCVVFISDLQAISATVTPVNVDTSYLKKILSSRLPSYMIPSYYNTCNQLPKNNNGKIDRKAIENINQNQSEIIPVNINILETLRRCWSNIFLNVEINDNDNFFELGGNSLLAIRLLDSCKKNGIDVTLSDLFNNPVLSLLSSNCKIYS